MRTSSTTHPWISFHIDPASWPVPLWMLLGECESKCEHIAGTPLRPDDAEAFYALYLTKGARATTAIEGNTLSEEQVRQHIAGTLKLPESQEYLAIEVQNIVMACAEIYNQTAPLRFPWEPVSRRVNPLDVGQVVRYNSLVLENLRNQPHVTPGQFRTQAIAVGMYRGVPYEEIGGLMDELVRWINNLGVAAGHPLVNAIVKAALAHLYIAWIHPFGDGNGRTARLLEFQLLLAGGAPAPAAHLLSNHYNLTRARYYQELENASISGGDVIPFLLYAIEGLRDGLREQIQQIRDIQHEVMWRDHIYRSLPGSSSESDVRKLNLILDLTAKHEPITAAEVPLLSPRLAKAYATKSAKTINRDLSALRDAGLIRDEGGRIVANKETILAWLPN